MIKDMCATSLPQILMPLTKTSFLETQENVVATSTKESIVFE
jgi:hypothetical protein